MPNVELTEEQVLNLVRQLPPDRRRAALLALASDASALREQRLQDAEARFRRVAANRGRDWDRMLEEEREAFADELVHEDRPCPP